MLENVSAELQINFLSVTIVEIFARVGLDGRFWDPKADQWHSAT
jgi:hypothetical protein